MDEGRVTIDGSFGEGGGQILRTSLALSAVTGASLAVRNIRAARPRPGLAAQHLAGARAVERVSRMRLRDARLGSVAIELDLVEGAAPLSPWTARDFPLRLDYVSTAGSTALVLQAVLPCLIRFLPSADVGRTTAIITGGTIAMAAPLADYVVNVLRPNLRAFGVDLDFRVKKDGFFPRGGGEIEVACRKDASLCSDADGKPILRPVVLRGRGRVLFVRGRVVIAGATEDKYGLDMVLSAKRVLRKRLGQAGDFTGEVDIDLDRVAPQDCSNGTVAAITLWATADGLDGSPQTVIGASGLRERRTGSKPLAEGVANELCDALDSGASVDSHMADQVAIFLAMASGESRVCISEPSLHTKTVVEVLRQFGVDCSIHLIANTSLYEIRCAGLGIALEP